MDKKKLAVFDIDGTLVLRGKSVPEDVVAGIENLHSKGFLTTVSTGRGQIRTKDVLADAFDTIISPESLLIVEHGTKVTHANGEVVHADYFEPNEVDHVIDFSQANADMIRLIWFILPDPALPMQVWCKDPADIEEETAKRGSYADVFHSSFDELRARLHAQPLSNVSVKLQPFISVENLRLHFTKSAIDTIFQDGMMEYIRNSSDKAKTVKYVLDYHHIDEKDLLVAGNAINDIAMLNINAGTRILVGNDERTDLVQEQLVRPEEVIRVDTPDDLGKYLLSL